MLQFRVPFLVLVERLKRLPPFDVLVSARAAHHVLEERDDACVGRVVDTAPRRRCRIHSNASTYVVLPGRLVVVHRKQLCISVPEVLGHHPTERRVRVNLLVQAQRAALHGLTDPLYHCVSERRGNVRQHDFAQHEGGCIEVEAAGRELLLGVGQVFQVDAKRDAFAIRIRSSR